MAHIPASIRNRNPGAMYPGPSASRYGSTSHETLRSKDGVHKIATFASHADGAAAMFDLLASPAYVGRTIEAAIAKWCGRFRVTSYIRTLEQGADVTRATVLTRDLLARPEIAVALARAMAMQEAGRDYPLSETEWTAAHARVFGAHVATEPAAPAGPPDFPGWSAVLAALRSSRTLTGALLATFGAIVSFFESAFAVLMEAAAKVAELGPARDLLAAAGANVKAVGAGLVVFGVVISVWRRVSAAYWGKVG